MNFKRMVLTDFKIDIPRLAKKKVLTAALEESGENCLPPANSSSSTSPHHARLSVLACGWLTWSCQAERSSRIPCCGHVMRMLLLTCTIGSLIVNLA